MLRWSSPTPDPLAGFLSLSAGCASRRLRPLFQAATTPGISLQRFPLAKIGPPFRASQLPRRSPQPFQTSRAPSARPFRRFPACTGPSPQPAGLPFPRRRRLPDLDEVPVLRSPAPLPFGRSRRVQVCSGSLWRPRSLDPSANPFTPRDESRAGRSSPGLSPLQSILRPHLELSNPRPGRLRPDFGGRRAEAPRRRRTPARSRLGRATSRWRLFSHGLCRASPPPGPSER
jgi:hypothetical protein